MTLATLSNIARSPGDPKVYQAGPSSLTPADNLARFLGWFSLALGVVELVAPGKITQSVGLSGKEGLVRAYGAREMVAGVQTLSMDKHIGLASRVVGDLIDIATLMPALSSRNPARGNAMIALGAVAAITALDCVAYSAVAQTHSRNRGQTRDYSDRSGFPKGIEAARGSARQPPLRISDYRQAADGSNARGAAA
jgi:hypothetical protein